MTARKHPSKRGASWSATKERRQLASTSAKWADEIEAALVAACHTKQRQALLDDGKRISVLTARGGGKTTTVVGRLIRKSTRRKRAVLLYFAPTRERARELIWDELKRLCEKLQIKARFSESRLICTIVKTGSRILLAGAESDADVEVYRGQSFDEVIVDESAVIKDKILTNLVLQVIGPRLGDRDGCIVLVGTPGRRRQGYWYSVTRPGSELHRRYEDRDQPEYAEWEGWSSHWWTMLDGAQEVEAIARLWADALLTKRREKWTDQNPIWMREYLGLWAEDNTLAIYTAYRAERNQWEPELERRGSMMIAKLPAEILAMGEILYAYGADLGHSDPFALNVFAWAVRDPRRRLWHVFGFEKKKLYAQKIAQLLLGEDEDRELKVRRADDPLGLIGATGWPAATAADMAGNGGAVLDELAGVYGVRLEPAKKADKYGCFEVVDGAFADERLYIMKDSQLENDIVTLQWSTNDAGQLVEPKGVPNHNSDSMVYVVPKASKMFEEVADSASSGQNQTAALPPPPPASAAPPPLKIDDDFGFVPDDDHADIHAHG